MRINPGVFNKKIEIVKYVITKDSDGFPENHEVILVKTWSQVTNNSGKEIQQSGSDFGEVKTRFLIRTPKQKIDKDSVIKFNSDKYNVVYVNDYNYDGKYTEIITELVKK